MGNKNLKSLDQFIDEQYGKRGTSKREKFEIGYEEFKLGVLSTANHRFQFYRQFP